MEEDGQMLQMAALLVRDYGDEAAREAMNRSSRAYDAYEAWLWRRVALSAASLLAADAAAMWH